MLRTNGYLLVAAALVAAAGCGGDDTVTSSTVSPSTTSATGASVVDTTAAPTPTAATTPPTATPATTAPATVPATTAPATAPPTVATTVPPPPSPTDAVTHVYATSRTDTVHAWQRLGVWDGTAWVDLADDQGYPDPTGTEIAVTSVDLPSVLTGAYGMQPWACIDADLHNGAAPTFAIPALPDDPAGIWRQQAIGVIASWPLQPRPVSTVGLDADIYQTIGESLLAGSGIDPSLGDVVQVFRVDLDGNGTEEVVVSFERITGPFGASGDMSLVYVRSIAGAGVDDIVLDEYVVEPPAPGDPEFPSIGGFRVAAIADLNGDARMEVVVANSGWEWGGTTVYEYDGTGFDAVIGGGCGV